MLLRFIRLLVLLAMMLAPVAMVGSHAAMAAPSAAAGAHSAGTADHCAPAPDEDGTPSSSTIDCTLFCSAMPSPGGGVPRAPLLAEATLVRPATVLGQGLGPSADPPPPRTA